MSLESDTPVMADPQSSNPGESPGAMVRQARERLNLSLDDLAGMTKLSYNVLEALERDDFSALLEPVYVRGYYRKCAKVLDMPEALLLQAYESRVAPKNPLPPAKLRLASGADFGSGSRLPIPRAILAALIAIIICAILWVVRGQSAQPPAPEQPVEVSSLSEEAAQAAQAAEAAALPAAPAMAAPQPAVPAGPAAVASVAPAGDAASAASGETAAPAAGTTSPALAPSPAAPAAAAPAAPGAQTAAAAGALTLRFNGTSWARVTDAAGKVLYDGLAQAGQSQVLAGQEPLSLFIGNAPVVQVEYRGAAVDLAPHTRSNKTARMTLPATS